MRGPLVVNGYGSYISLSGDSITVRNYAEVIEKNLIKNISHIIIHGSGVSISSDAIIRCARSNIPVIVLDSIERPRALVWPVSKRQITESNNSLISGNRALALIIKLLEMKLKRQHAVVHYHARSLRRTLNIPLINFNTAIFINALRETVKKYHQSSNFKLIRDELFLIEARSGRVYWHVFAKLIKPEISFSRRVKRHPADPVNQLLNYGYAMLSSIVLLQILKAGINPGAGLFHHRQGAAYPLVFDIMEPFRPIIDHVVLAFLHRQHRSLQDKEGMLRALVLRRFRRLFRNVSLHPEPWSRSKKSLESIISLFLTILKN